MDYDSLHRITAELHTAGVPVLRLREISQILNQWTTQTSLDNLLLLVNDHRNQTESTTFTYVLSTLEQFIARNQMALIKNGQKQTEIFEALAKYTGQRGFIKTKVCKCIALMVVISMQESRNAIQVCSNFPRPIHLEILQILFEEIDNNDHMTRLRPKVHDVILSQPELIIPVVTDSLQKLSDFQQNKAEVMMAIKLLGSLGSIYSLSTDNLGDCFKHVVSFAVKPTEENVEISAQILETIIDFVSGKNKSCSTVMADYRTNPTSLAVFSSILESIFQVIATLTENEALCENFILK
ncbi:Oidioi.mRNA.OKI2018_I69.chr1.g2315.t1.cds [Oikopleura dioica]|uniref:Oidioi.mRNA.OKI2018_I69.chr1.g2315.t1.cds n=1 Tax=Oikopleura dioica TaxID=34765 RepID=A0ABN7SXN3_OIKDI|nr:Oidioi.mRNA.OKI2018_I69.chr1.g2315.t1.cds [Oikopleura dioica]